MKNLTKIALVILAVVTVGITGCKKESSNGDVMIRMTDAPAQYSEVNVDVQQVHVHFTGNKDDNGWIILNTNAGIYNLLELQNGVSQIITVQQPIGLGKITQIRLVLGQNNTVVADGIIYPLELSSQDKTGLKINTNFDVRSGQIADVLIDFDAEKSIVIEGDATYKLKPVIHVKNIMYHN